MSQNNNDLFIQGARKPLHPREKKKKLHLVNSSVVAQLGSNDYQNVDTIASSLSMASTKFSLADSKSGRRFDF